MAGQIAAFATVARADAIDNPPPGIKPTVATLSDVLLRYEKVNDKPDRSVKARELTWRISAFGLEGSVRRVESGGDYRETITLGPFVQSRGKRAELAWRQNENGLTFKLTGLHQRDAVSARAVQAAEKNPQSRDVKLVGEVGDPVPAYVVEVNPPDGRHEWLFFDKTSGLLVRREAVVVDRRVVSTYEDFRAADGLTDARHLHISDGRPTNDEDWRLNAVRVNPPLTPTDLDVPRSVRNLVEFPNGVSEVRLPARIARGKIIIRVWVQGRGLDFVLDSGSSGIVFDRGVTQLLRLPIFGRSTQTTAGSYEQTSTRVPEIGIGDLRLRNVVATSLPYTLNPAGDVKVVGLLGYDFIAGAALRVDYEHETVDAIRAESGWMPANAIVLPAALDDGVPYVAARLGDVESKHFILDTGASSGVVFSDFARAHKDALADQGLGWELRQTDAFCSARGVGGSLSVLPTQVKSFAIDGHIFDDWVFYVLQSSRAFQGEDEDGLIGYDILRYFTVYLDYANSRVVLQRNGLRIERPQPPPKQETLPPSLR